MNKKILLLGVFIIFLMMNACNIEKPLEKINSNESQDTTIVDTQKEEKIILNGNVEEDVEAGNDYVEKGVNMPNGYTYNIKGKVFANTLGRYELVYQVFSNTGELKKELHRFVNVVDTTAPTFEETELSVLNLNTEYKVSDFIKKYEDNYDLLSNIEVIVKSPLLYSQEGHYIIEIIFTDSSGNVSTYQKEVQVKVDSKAFFDKLRTDKRITENDSFMYVRVTDGISFFYYKDGRLAMIKNYDTKLGKKSSVQVSPSMGSLEKATLDYHVTSQYTSTEYTTIFFYNCDITGDCSNIHFDKFDGNINGLNLDLDAVLAEFNERVIDAIASYKSYLIYDWSVLYTD